MPYFALGVYRLSVTQVFVSRQIGSPKNWEISISRNVRTFQILSKVGGKKAAVKIKAS
jgi:hypothetical protein